MYNNTQLGGLGLAATGSVAFNALWMFLAAFALIAGAMALGRILPKRS